MNSIKFVPGRGGGGRFIMCNAISLMSLTSLSDVFRRCPSLHGSHRQVFDWWPEIYVKMMLT